MKRIAGVINHNNYHIIVLCLVKDYLLPIYPNMTMEFIQI